MKLIRRTFNLYLLSALAFTYANLAYACSDYIDYQEGNVPILLTSPHGAGKAQLLPSVPPRQGGDFKRFVNRADQYTDKLTWSIAKYLKQNGFTPFVVVAGVHRSQIDFNRPPEQAYETVQAESCYRYYHQRLRHALNNIRDNWQYGFMLDVHGQSKYDYEILRGTRNKETIEGLIQRFGKDVSEEENGFFTVLREKTYHIHPRRHKRERYYYGGFTLKQYGSHLPNGIDAMQVEIGRAIRKDKDRREKMAADIAEAITRFYQRYYTLSPQSIQ